MVETTPETCPVCTVVYNNVSTRIERDAWEVELNITTPVRELHAECDSYPCSLFPEASCNQMFCVWDERGFCREPDADSDPIARINLAHDHFVHATYTNAKGESISLKPDMMWPPFRHEHRNYATLLNNQGAEIKSLIDIVYYTFSIPDTRMHIEVSNPALFCSTFSAHTEETVHFWTRTGSGPTMRKFYATTEDYKIEYVALCNENTGATDDFTVEIVPDCANIRRDVNCSKFGCRDPYADVDPELEEVIWDTPVALSSCQTIDRLSFEQANRITLVQIARSGTPAENVPTPGVYTHSPVTSIPTRAPTTLNPTRTPTVWEPGPAHECKTDNGLYLDSPEHRQNSYYYQVDICDDSNAFFNRDGYLQSCVKHEIGSQYVNGLHACLT